MDDVSEGAGVGAAADGAALGVVDGVVGVAALGAVDGTAVGDGVGAPGVVVGASAFGAGTGAPLDCASAEAADPRPTTRATTATGVLMAATIARNVPLVQTLVFVNFSAR